MGLILRRGSGPQKVHDPINRYVSEMPFRSDFVRDVRDALFGIPSVREVHVRLTLDPPWTVDKVSKEARNKLIGIPVGVEKDPKKGPA